MLAGKGWLLIDVMSQPFTSRVALAILAILAIGRILAILAICLILAIRVILAIRGILAIPATRSIRAILDPHLHPARPCNLLDGYLEMHFACVSN